MSLLETDIQAYLETHERKDLLRFITCGSVDDGKSTLIGRLLYDTQLIYEDQLAAVRRDTTKYGTTGEELDLALLVDGLQSEREQGITIDVAYRYFSTDKRKFIIADTPGHEQYTRNMATGASTAQLAILLVDARKGVQTQTRRHSFIVSLLGIRHLLLAVNKMDLVGYDPAVFARICDDYLEFVAKLGVKDVRCVPVSALRGDNVAQPSTAMPWYEGPTLLQELEQIEVAADRNLRDFRFPVQYVNRPHLDFRGFCGTLAAGMVRPGDEVVALPSGRRSRVTTIVTADGNLPEAFAGQAVTLTLADEIDIGRGDLLVHPDCLPAVAEEFDARVVWMADAPLLPGRQYDIKLATRLLPATPTVLHHRIDVNTLEHQRVEELGLNEIGYCRFSLNQPVPFDAYEESPGTGGFIVIDRISNATVGAGMIDFALRRARNIHWHEHSNSTRRSAVGRSSTRRPCVHLVHRSVGLRQVDHRQPDGAAAARNEGQHTYHARRRQRPPRAEPATSVFHGSGPRREHPARRRSRQADGGCRPGRPRPLHLAVQAPNGAWRAALLRAGEFIEMSSSTRRSRSASSVT
jgi:bifunctional enzyme CysN/CysC